MEERITIIKEGENPPTSEEAIEEIEKILTDLESRQGEFNSQEEEARINELSKFVDENELENRFGKRMKKLFSTESV